MKDRARRVLATRGVDVRRPPAVLLTRPEAHLQVELGHLVAQLVLSQPDVFFLQIGAFDGRTGDQIHDYVTRWRWRGVLVEPQPRYFRALQETYAGHDQLTLHQVAVSERRETRTLYSIRDDDSNPDWAGQIATFDRSRLGDFEGRIEEQQVPCIPIADLLVGVDRVDLLQVDVEGYDAEIIRMFPFESYLPSVVRFENWCLNRADHARAVSRLVDFDYRVAVTGNDTVAWHD